MKGGNSFTIFKDENYSSDASFLRVKGADQKGNSYEERINAKTVNPCNSSFVELMALYAYLVCKGTLKADIEFFTRENTDDLAKQNYMSIFKIGEICSKKWVIGQDINNFQTYAMR